MLVSMVPACPACERSGAATHLAATAPRLRPAPLKTAPGPHPTTSAADSPPVRKRCNHPLRPATILDSLSAIRARPWGRIQGGLLCVSNPARLGAMLLRYVIGLCDELVPAWGADAAGSLALACPVDHGS